MTTKRVESLRAPCLDASSTLATSTSKRAIFRSFFVLVARSFSLWRLGELVCGRLLFACANQCACKAIVSENKFSPHCFPTPTIFDCNNPTSVTSQLQRPFDSQFRVETVLKALRGIDEFRESGKNGVFANLTKFSSFPNFATLYSLK